MKEKSLDKRRNASIHRMESKGKFWINLFKKKKIRKRSHNAAFSESKNSFSDQVKTIFFT